MPDSIGATNSTSTSAIRTLEDISSKRQPTQELGKNEFLQILVMQMANQDPLEPTKDSDFIAQMAQFSALEQMQNLNSNVTLSNAYNLTGKYVSATIYNDDMTVAEIVTGKVSAVTVQNGIAYCQIGDKMVPASNINHVLDSNLYEGNDMLGSANIIGKHVYGSYQDAQDNIVVVNGQVDRIIMQGGTIYAVVGDQQLAVHLIEEISPNPITRPEPTP